MPIPPPPSRKEGANAAGCPCPLPRLKPIPVPPPSPPTPLPPPEGEETPWLRSSLCWVKEVGNEVEDPAPDRKADCPAARPARLLPKSPARPVPSPPPPALLPGNPRPMLRGTPPGIDGPIPPDPPLVPGPRTQLPVPPVSLARKPRMAPMAGTPESPMGARAIGRSFFLGNEEAAAERTGLEGEEGFVALIHGCVLGCSSSAGKSRTQSSSMNS